MKSLSKLTFGVMTLGLGISVFSSALADESSVHFSIPGTQNVSCTVADPTATVTLSTHRVKAQGYCPGNGSIILEGKTVNEVYFRVKPDSTSNPYFKASTNRGSVTCSLSSGSNRSEYAPGQKFCLYSSDSSSQAK